MLKRSYIYVFSIISLFIIYVILSNIVDNEILLPKIHLIIDYFKNLKLSVLLKHTSSTLFKALSSYLFSLIFALIIAIIASFKKINLIINPYISILRTIPTISIILIALIWLGNEKAIYIIPFLVIFPILYETIYFHINNLDPKLKQVCDVYQFNSNKKIKYLYFYSLLEGLMLSFKQTFGLCFKIIVMAEVIAQANMGIGAKIQNEKINLDMSGVFSWTIILIILILIIDFILDFGSRRLIKWKC